MASAVTHLSYGSEPPSVFARSDDLLDARASYGTPVRIGKGNETYRIAQVNIIEATGEVEIECYRSSTCSPALESSPAPSLMVWTSSLASSRSPTTTGPPASTSLRASQVHKDFREQIVTLGAPCQDLSVAGKHAHWLETEHQYRSTVSSAGAWEVRAPHRRSTPLSGRTPPDSPSLASRTTKATFVEWLMGLPSDSAANLSRTARIRLAGNAVVGLQRGLTAIKINF